MEIPSELADIMECCRLCLKNNSILRNIFQNDYRNWVQADISQQIYDASKIKVTINDGPTKICRQCFHEISKIITFQKRCARINEYFLSNYRKKTFTVDFNEPIATTKDTKENDAFVSFFDLGNEKQLQTCNYDLEDNFVKFDEQCDSNIPSLLFVGFENDATDNKSNSENDSETDKNDTDANKDSFTDEKDKSTDNIVRTTKRPYVRKKEKLCSSLPHRRLCPTCGKLFTSLSVHLRSHNPIPAYTCHFCGRSSKSKAHLKIHMLLHQEAAHACAICGQKFTLKTRLKRHQRIHTNERPYPCDICQKKFYTSHNLKVHMLMHTGEKPHSCHFCTDKFAHSYSLKHHIQKFHQSI